MRAWKSMYARTQLVPRACRQWHWFLEDLSVGRSMARATEIKVKCAPLHVFPILLVATKPTHAAGTYCQVVQVINLPTNSISFLL